jgi:hypothetical protein
MHMSRELQRAVLVIAFFALLSGITLSPLSLHLNSRVPAKVGGEWDYYHFQWNLWWVRYAVEHGQDPFYTNKVLAPFRHNLTYHSLTPSLMPLYAALEPLVGHLRASNLIIWISVALTGIATYGLLRRHGISRLGALLGGVALGFSPYMLDHAGSGHLNLITVWWLPLLLVVWEKVTATRRIRWAALAGLVLWGMWMTDTLIIFWGGLLLAPYGLLTLVQAPDRRARRRVILLGGLALAITFALAWVIGPLRQTLAFDTSQLEPARYLTLRYYSVPLKAFILPNLGSAQRVGFERDETLGLLLVVLAWAGLIVRTRDRLRWFWLAAALPPLILTLGPDVTILGVQVPLPFRLVHVAFHGQMRTPIRFLPPAMTALILYVAHTYDPWLRKARPAMQRVLAVGLVLALIVDYGILKPYPASVPPPSYSFYEMMRAENYPNYDYVVLEVPSGPYTGWRLIGSHPEAMVYGVIHEKRMVSGLLSRMPLNEHLFYEQSALMGWLTDSRPLDASRAGVELKRFVDQWPIGYVVVHQDWMDTERTQQVLDFFNGQPSLCYIETERDAVLYRTSSHPKGCPPRTPPQTAPGVYTITFGQPGDEGFIGHGWYGPENIGGETARWAGDRPEALLYASLPPGPAYTLTVRAVAFAEPRTIKVVAAGNVPGGGEIEKLGTITVSPGDWSEHSLTIPAELVRSSGGSLVFSLSADGMASAADLGLSTDPRPLTLAYDWVQFRATGGG